MPGVDRDLVEFRQIAGNPDEEENDADNDEDAAGEEQPEVLPFSLFSSSDQELRAVLPASPRSSRKPRERPCSG